MSVEREYKAYMPICLNTQPNYDLHFVGSDPRIEFPYSSKRLLLEKFFLQSDEIRGNSFTHNKCLLPQIPTVEWQAR